MVASGSPLELKQRYMTGELLLVECDAIGKALELLQSAPGVEDAAIFGNALHLVVAKASEAVGAVQDFLAEHAIAVTRIEPIRPSLEDVFVSLTTARNGAKPGVIGKMNLNSHACDGKQEIIQIMRDDRACDS
jgi:ABC-2 type transport system ATP-binding protein